jgi:pimeloyl-ACP methyl ester carboxylesterase
MDMMQTSVPLPDGMVLRVTQWSTSASPHTVADTIVLLHGLGDAAIAWLGVAPMLAERHRVLAVDLRGHGDSAWSDERDYSMDAYTADIEALFDRLDLGTVSLVGHSLGAAIALRYTVRHPQKVAALVMVDHGPDVANASAQHIRNVLRDAHRVYAHADDYAALLMERHPLGDKELLKRVAGASLRPAPASGLVPKYDPQVVDERRDPLSSVGGSQTADETWQLLGKLRARTAMLRGMGSSVLPAAVAKRMIEIVGARATLDTIPMAGHAVHLDNPAGLRRALLQFFG